MGTRQKLKIGLGSSILTGKVRCQWEARLQNVREIPTGKSGEMDEESGRRSIEGGAK